MLNDVSASSGISPPLQAVNSMSNDLLDYDLCKNYFISTFFRFSNM